MGQIKEWIQSSQSLSIFLTGKTGSGKSTLVNALVGEEVAEEGEEPDPMTAEVTCYARKRSGIDMKVFDSPGLQDGTGNEERYTADIKAKCVDIDLYLFCINVAESVRFNRDSREITAIKKLTEVFGRALWNNAVIALTFANEIEDNNDEMSSVKAQITRAERRVDILKKRATEGDSDAELKDAQDKLDEEKKKLENFFGDKIREWDDELREMLKNDVGLDAEQVKALQIIPTGFREPVCLPDRPHWLSTFWFSVLRSTHKRAQPALLHMNRDRIIENLDELSESDLEKHEKDQALVLMERGAEAGKDWGDAALGSYLGLKMAQMASINLYERLLVDRFLHAIVIVIEGEEDSPTQPQDCASPPVEEPGKPVEEPGKPVEEPGKPVEEPGKPVGEPGKPVEEPRKPVEEPGKPVEEPGKPVEEPGKPVEELGKPVGEPGKPVEEPGKPAEEPGKPVEEPGKPVEEPSKPVEEPGKEKNEMQQSSCGGRI